MNRQAEEQAEMAEQLHSQMFPSEPTGDEAQEEEIAEQPEQETDEEAIPHDDDIEELRKFKARYLSLQGKYDAEVPRLHNELKEFKQSVFERLESQIKPVQPETPKEDKFAKFKEEYGEDLYNVINEIADLRSEEKLKTSLQPVQDQVASVEDIQIQAAQQNFVAYLDSKVSGDWHSLWAGKDPKFFDFLQQPDPSGLYTYGQLVEAYNNNWDADKLSVVLNTYLETKKPVTRQPRPEQQAIVAPSRQNTHTTPTANEAIIWTKESMKDFQDKDRQGKYSPEQSKAMWDDLLSAPMQGRLR